LHFNRKNPRNGQRHVQVSSAFNRRFANGIVKSYAYHTALRVCLISINQCFSDFTVELSEGYLFDMHEMIQIDKGGKRKEVALIGVVHVLPAIQNSNGMDTNAVDTSGTRPLFINFDQYTDGDLEFKNELIDLMIDNLHELIKTLTLSQQEGLQPFERTLHKVKPTIVMLDDPGLNKAIADLTEGTGTLTRQQQESILNTRFLQIIKSLQLEKKKA
jgi:hypothetical protein